MKLSLVLLVAGLFALATSNPAKKQPTDVITTTVKGDTVCSSQQALVDCVKPLSVLTDFGLTFASSKADLDKICPDLKEALKCIHAYTRHCMNNDHRRHFRKLFHGTGSMVYELCRSGSNQEEYLKYAPCMKQAEEENKVCFKRYTKAMNNIQDNTPDVNMSEPDIANVFNKTREVADEGIKNVCCSYQEYVDCSTHTMRSKCGEEAAEFSRRFMDKMSPSMVQHCTEYGRRECELIPSSSTIENSTLANVYY